MIYKDIGECLQDDRERKKLIEFAKQSKYIIHIVLVWAYFNTFFRRLKKKIAPVEVLFISQLEDWKEMINISGKRDLGDMQMEWIIRETVQRHKIIVIDLDAHVWFRDHKKTKYKFKTVSYNVVCIEQFLTLRNILITSLRLIRHILGVKEDLDCQNFSEIANMNIGSAFFKLSVAESILKQCRPKAVVYPYEFDVYPSAIAYLAHKSGIAVVGLQHGQSKRTGNLSGYKIEDVKAKARLPDITCLYGSYYRDLLINYSIYDEKMVTVTGVSRYDSLAKADTIYSKEEVLKRYNISPSKKVILWTGQFLGLSYEENIKNMDAIFSAMKDLPESVLMLKMHPREKKKNVKLVKGHLKNYDINVVLITENLDTDELIFASDLLITRHSTTALEAIALDKPVIVLNLSGEPDPVDYVDEGVALGVRRAEDLKPAIEKVLKDDSDLAKNRGRYIEKYLYKIDGRATERVVKVIEEQLQTAKNRNS